MSTANEQGLTDNAQRLPEVNFATFVLSLASSALVQLGEVPDPESGETRQNPLLARHNIDVLAMLREKTRGNLTSKEQQMLDSMLYELRMKYVILCGKSGDCPDAAAERN